MTTLDAVHLEPSLQALLDARLDTIERMLMGKLSRQDRLAIVRDVETQIFEQLQGRNVDDLTREDVLAVLAALDSPEAYLPEESGSASMGHRALPDLPSRSLRGRSPSSGKSKAGGILGIVTIVCAVLLPCFGLALAIAFQSATMLFFIMGTSILLTLIGAIVSIVFAVRAGLRTGWSVTGLVTSLAAVFVSIGLNTLFYFIA